MNVQFAAEPIQEPIQSLICFGSTEDSMHDDHSTELSVEGEVAYSPEMNKSPGFSDIKELLDAFDEQSEKKKETAKLASETTCHDSDEEAAASNWFVTTKKRKDVILKTVLRRCRKFF